MNHEYQDSNDSTSIPDYSIVRHSKSLYCTLSAVNIFSLMTFSINTSRYTSNTTSTRLLREATTSYSKRPHGTQLQKGCTLRSGLAGTVPEVPSEHKRKDQILVANLMHSLHLGFLHWIKVCVGLDEQRPIAKSFPGCSLLPVQGNQLLLTSVWTSLASCKSLSLVNLVRPLH